VGEREAEDVDRAQPCRQRERPAERRTVAVAQFLEVREPLPPPPQQSAHADAPQRPFAQPLDERRSGDHAAEVDPGPHVAQRVGRVGPLDGRAHVRPALAE
jgi:hypothetical protein